MHICNSVYIYYIVYMHIMRMYINIYMHIDILIYACAYTNKYIMLDIIHT